MEQGSDHIDLLGDFDPRTVRDVADALRQAGIALMGLRGGRHRDIDPLGPESQEELSSGWDVLQNEAEARLPEGSDVAAARRLIDNTFDPKWREAIRVWSLRNQQSPPDDRCLSQSFAAAAQLDLTTYSELLQTCPDSVIGALEYGRLPCPSDLVARAPEMARLAAQLWRLMSTDSPTHVTLFQRALDMPAPVDGSSPEIVDNEPSGPSGRTSSQSGQRPTGLSPQQSGERLEQSVVDVLELLFRLAPDDEGRLRGQLRRQRAGTQYGTDIIFRARAISSTSTCLVECKNYKSAITVKDIADKLLQAEGAFDNEPVDHWILLSPHMDPSNELDRLVERWNTQGRFPFKVQVWSPQSSIQKLFALLPQAYSQVYDGAPPPLADRQKVVDEFNSRLRPVLRLNSRLEAYVRNPRQFLQGNEATWLKEMGTSVERHGFDDKGARLAAPLKPEIVSVLTASGSGAVALLIADFGEGKSFLTASLCVDLHEEFLRLPTFESLIPVRFFLREFRHMRSPLDFLRNRLEQLGLTMGDWRELTQDWKVVVVLDGMDEMSVRQDVTTTRENFDKIGELIDLFEGIPVLVTSRPHLFASTTDRERFYDRLRRPRVFRLAQPDRRETVAHLRSYAKALNLGDKLERIKELYDPIGLAGKVLFLDMIKATLPDLPDDHFDELVLYDTYVRVALERKIELLRDPDYALDDEHLLNRLEETLERIAVAIHVGGEGTVDLRNFLTDAGSAVSLLWRASDPGDISSVDEDDAQARLANRSLLRRVSAETDSGSEESWLVDFFHRSMKEFFVAKALARALEADDPFAATRELLLKVSIQSEVAGFFKLMSSSLTGCQDILSSLAHSARVGTDQGYLGGGAVSLYHVAGGRFYGTDWASLVLDGALLPHANFTRTDLRYSSLRGVNLSSADLTSADLRGCDLTEANLDVGDVIIDISRDLSTANFICLTSASKIIRVQPVGQSLRCNELPATSKVRWPRRLLALPEDIVVLVGDSEALIYELRPSEAREVARFRISNSIRSVDMIGHQLLGLALDLEDGGVQAGLVDLSSGELLWQIRVATWGTAARWCADGILVAHSRDVFLHLQDGSIHHVVQAVEASALALLDPEANASSAGRAVLGTSEGYIMYFNSNDDVLFPSELPPTHSGSVAALAHSDIDVLSSGADGSLILSRTSAEDGHQLISQVERRLKCEGALVDGLTGERELQMLLANGAITEL